MFTDLTIILCEEDRQATLLALAELALSRPGWDCMLRLIAEKLCGEALFDEFKRVNADRVKAERGPLLAGETPAQQSHEALYEALERIEKYVAFNFDSPEGCKHNVGVMARAALAKARGEAVPPSASTAPSPPTDATVQTEKGDVK